MTRRTFAALLAAAATAANQDAATAFDHFYNLEFDQAISIFRGLTRQHPDDASMFNHLAQSILYREMLRAGALETELVTGGNAFLRRAPMNPSAEDTREFDDAIAASMRISHARLAANPNDKTGLYGLGISRGLRGNYSFLVRKAWLDALRDATAARKAHNRLTELDPSLIDARLTQGLHQYVLGSLSWYYRRIGFLAGLRGGKEDGIKAVELVWQKGQNNRDDAAIVLATIYRRERRADAAVPLLNHLAAKFPRNYLIWFELAQMESDLGHKDKALEAIANVETRNIAPIEKVRYYRGTIQFWYRDFDDALSNFLAVTAKADSLDPNTGVTAWLRLGQTYDMKGNRPKAIEAYKRCIAYAPDSYRAKEAGALLKNRYKGH